MPKPLKQRPLPKRRRPVRLVLRNVFRRPIHQQFAAFLARLGHKVGVAIDDEDGVAVIDEGVEDFDELAHVCHVQADGGFIAAFGNESRQGVPIKRLPKAFDGVGVGTVRRKVDRFEVMPVESLDLVPAGIVENQHTPSTLSRRSFLCHRVEESLEDIAIAVWNDQADKLTALGMDRSQDIFPDTLAEVPPE